MTIVEFLQARLAEDAAPPLRIPEGQRVWTVDGGSIHAGHPTDLIVDWVYDDHAEHIARHDPARVLREVEAKRRILDDYERAHGYAQDPCCGRTVDRVIELLALPYADHPDYDPSWSPT